MLEYVTPEELARRLGKPDFTDEDAAEAEALLEALSRAVENHLEVPKGYYYPPGDELSTRRVYGVGTPTINLPSPVFGDVTVAAVGASGIVPNFDVEGSRLIALTEAGYHSPYTIWDAGVAYDVTGQWGFEEIPPELKEAIKLIASRTWLERPDGGYKGMVRDITQYEGVISRGWPTSARIILDGLKAQAVVEAAASNNFYLA